MALIPTQDDFGLSTRKVADPYTGKRFTYYNLITECILTAFDLSAQALEMGLSLTAVDFSSWGVLQSNFNTTC